MSVFSLMRVMLSVALLSVLTGCITLLEQEEQPTSRYQLHALKGQNATTDSTLPPLIIPLPEMGVGLSSADIAILEEGNELRYLSYAEWSDPLPNVVQDMLLKSFQRMGRLVMTPQMPVAGEYQRLNLRVNAFNADYAKGKNDVVISIYVALQHFPSRKVIGHGLISHRQSVEGFGEQALVATFDRVMKAVQQDILAHYEQWNSEPH